MAPSTPSRSTRAPDRLPRTPRVSRTPKPGSPSVADYLNTWLANRQTLRSSTRRAYGIHVERYLVPHIGQVALDELTVFDVERMYRSITSQAGAAGRPLSPTTVRRVHATLMSALSSAVRRGLLPRNPAAHVELPRAATPDTAVWTAGQVAAFLDANALHRLHPLFLLYAATGMRRGEALGLRWRDVDLERRTLRVEQQLTVVGADLLLGPPKTASGRRTVAVSEQVITGLRQWAGRQQADRDAAGPAWVDTGLLFTVPDGRPLHPGQVSREFARLSAALGLPVIRLHDLRHTSASLGLMAGETLLEVSRRLGHSSISITADVYSHVAPETARASADRLAALIATTGTCNPGHPTHSFEPGGRTDVN